MPATPSLRRWSLSLLAVLLAHGLAAAWLVRRPAQPMAAGTAPAAILIDLAPPAAPADATPRIPAAPASAPVTPAPVPIALPAPTRQATDAAPPPPKPPEPAPAAPRPDTAAATPPASTAAAEPDGAAPVATPPPATTAVPDTAAAPGTAAPSGRASGAQRAAEASWQSRLLGHLEGFRRYPMRALRQRHEGVTYLRFSVDRRGAVTAVRLERGSGSAALDAEALEVVRRAQPLPAPPREIEGDPVEVVVPVEFRLRRR